MRLLPGIAGRLDRRQFIATVIAAAGIGVILLAVGLHAAGLPSLFPDSTSDRLTTGDGVTVEEPAPVIPIAAPVEVGPSTGGSPVGALLSGAADVPPSRATTAPRGAPPQTTSTTAPPPSPPPPTTTTTLPALIPGLPIGAPGASLR